MEGRIVVAICDRELVGKKLGMDFEVKANRDFYGDKIINEEEALELMKNSTVGNILGKRIVKFALKKRFITEENVMFIGDVPHAQFIR